MGRCFQVIGIGVVALVGIGVILAVMSGGDDSNGSGADETPPDPLVVDIEELRAAYDANQVAADSQYEDQYLRVENGHIGNIHGSGSISVQPESPGWSILCRGVPEEVVVGLTNGDPVTMEGWNQGMSLGSLTVNDCEVIEEGAG